MFQSCLKYFYITLKIKILVNCFSFTTYYKYMNLAFLSFRNINYIFNIFCMHVINEDCIKYQVDLELSKIKSILFLFFYWNLLFNKIFNFLISMILKNIFYLTLLKVLIITRRLRKWMLICL